MYKKAGTDANSWAVIILGCLGLFALFFGIFLATAWVFMVAWNVFIPAAFDGSTIDYNQAMAGTLLLWVVGGFFRTIESKR